MWCINFFRNGVSRKAVESDHKDVGEHKKITAKSRDKKLFQIEEARFEFSTKESSDDDTDSVVNGLSVPLVT